MADKQIGALTAVGTPLDGTELVHVVEGGNSRKATTQDIADLAASAPSYEAGPPTPPTDAGLSTWDNQGTSTWTDSTNAGVLRVQADSVLHGKYMAAPSTPYSVYARVNIQHITTTAITNQVIIGGGILLKDTAGDNERLLLELFMERVSGDEQPTWGVQLLSWSGASPPVVGSADAEFGYNNTHWPWLKLDNDGTTLTYSIGPDGFYWVQIGTQLLSAHIDAAGSIGIGGRANSAAGTALISCSYFSTTAPS